MKIFRIQDIEGRGPWKPGFSSTWVETRDDHENLKPWYVEFAGTGLLKANVGDFFGCGCSTIKQLRRWFTKSEYQTLLAHGYQCVEMSVDKILVTSETQCVFTRRHPLNQGCVTKELYNG